MTFTSGSILRLLNTYWCFNVWHWNYEKFLWGNITSVRKKRTCWRLLTAFWSLPPLSSLLHTRHPDKNPSLYPSSLGQWRFQTISAPAWEGTPGRVSPPWLQSPGKPQSLLLTPLLLFHAWPSGGKLSLFSMWAVNFISHLLLLIDLISICYLCYHLSQ